MDLDENSHECTECGQLVLGNGSMHELKIRPEYFEMIIDGQKTFEVRRDDRGFQKGDVLHLRCLDKDGRYDARKEPVNCLVLWVLTGGQLGIEPGYVVMSIKVIKDDS